MPKPPDFEQIARDLMVVALKDDDVVRMTRGIVEQLRQVWNARGAADVALIETIAPFPAKVSIDALRSLDR